MKSVIIVSRQWHKPEIEIELAVPGIAIALKIEDYIKILSSELQISEEKIAAITEKIVDEMKQSTVRAV